MPATIAFLLAGVLVCTNSGQDCAPDLTPMAVASIPLLTRQPTLMGKALRLTETHGRVLQRVVEAQPITISIY